MRITINKIVIYNHFQDNTVLICESSNDLEPSSFSWFKVNPVDGAEVEVTNAVGNGITVNGGELTIRVGNLENGDRYRCKVDEEVCLFRIKTDQSWNIESL
jgi:hypothetical protein